MALKIVSLVVWPGTVCLGSSLNCYSVMLVNIQKIHHHIKHRGSTDF